jgi:cytochrome c oxidase subunit IV
MTAHVPLANTVASPDDAGAHVRYMRVWFWLAALTTAEYFYAWWAQEWFVFLLTGLLLLAIVKAAMVGWYFMHLKFEGKWVFILIIPAFVLAAILTLALAPDIGMRAEPEESTGEESVFVVPAGDGSPLTVFGPASLT